MIEGCQSETASSKRPITAPKVASKYPVKTEYCCFFEKPDRRDLGDAMALAFPLLQMLTQAVINTPR